MNNTLIKPNEIAEGGILAAFPISGRMDASRFPFDFLRVAEVSYLVKSCVLSREMYKDMKQSQFPGLSQYNEDQSAIQAKFPNDPNYEDLWIDGGLRGLTATACLYQCLPFIHNPTTSNGVAFNVSTMQESIPDGDKKVQQALRATLQRMQEQVVRFIIDNIDEYPLWNFDYCESCYSLEICKCDIKNNKSRNKAGLIFPSSYRKVKINDKYHKNGRNSYY